MPLHSLQRVAPQALLGLWHLTEPAEELLATLPSPNWYAEQLPPGRDDARARHWLGARVLAHTILEALQPGTQATLTNNADGRPYFVQAPGLAVSLSHSGEWVAALIQDGGRVGTDIELVRAKARQLGRRFLTDTELLDAGEEELKYCLYWSAKETLYKLHSRRALVFREQILLEPFRLREAGSMTGYLLHENSRSQHQVYYTCLGTSYVLTYCLDAPLPSRL